MPPATSTARPPRGVPERVSTAGGRCSRLRRSLSAPKGQRRLLRRPRALDRIPVRRNIDRNLGRLPFLVGCTTGLRQAELARTIVAFLFDVIILGQLRNPQSPAAELSQLLQNNLGPSVVLFHRTMNLDHLILQLAHIPDALQIMRKNHYGERTHHGILTEIEKCNAPASMLYAKHFAGNASVLADVLARLNNGNAVRGHGKGREERYQQQERGSASERSEKSTARGDLGNKQSKRVPYVSIVGRASNVRTESTEKYVRLSRNRKRRTKSRSRLAGPHRPSRRSERF